MRCSHQCKASDALVFFLKPNWAQSLWEFREIRAPGLFLQPWEIGLGIVSKMFLFPQSLQSSDSFIFRVNAFNLIPEVWMLIKNIMKHEGMRWQIIHTKEANSKSETCEKLTFCSSQIFFTLAVCHKLYHNIVANGELALSWVETIFQPWTVFSACE